VEWVGWAFPNIADRHHLVHRDKRARNADLAWYGRPPGIDADRLLQGMTGKPLQVEAASSTPPGRRCTTADPTEASSMSPRSAAQPAPTPISPWHASRCS
jgi:hypothetical protein